MLRLAPTELYGQQHSHIPNQCQHSRSRLLNLTGFFSSGAGAPMVVELILWGCLVEDAGPDQGERVLRR
jgi:hypothetical protein